MGLTKRDETAHEIDELGGMALDGGPVDPAHLVVLTIRIVVAVLRVSELIPGKQHRRSLRKEQRRQEIPPLLCAQRENRRIVAWTLGAAIPAVVVGMTVPA